MTDDYSSLFSEDAMAFVPSPVRAIFGRYDMSRVISFAGGYPSPDTFPLRAVTEALSRAFEEYGPGVLQYGATLGTDRLRRALASRYGVPFANVGITTSSQQGIDLCTRVLADPSDVIIVSQPTFLGALQSFRSFRADVRGIPYCEDPEELAAAYRRCIADARSEGRKVKFIYLIPEFSNPSGETLSLQARAAIVRVAREESVLVVEDSPYRELRYEGEDIPSMYSMAPDAVIHLGSFSKILAPGFRLGWVFAPQPVLDKFAACKQSADLCPPVPDQHIAAALLEDGTIDRGLVRSRGLYRRKRDLMLSCLEREMPSGVSWNIPQGGLFIFMTLPRNVDTVAMYDLSLSRGLAYVSGAFFRTDGAGRNTMRLNFSFVSEDDIRRGTALLGQILREVSGQ